VTARSFVRSFVCLGLVAALAPALRASAQEALDPADTARFRFGPLRFTPWIAVKSIGVDSNVFNETVNPKQDNTATLGPATDVWMRVAGTRMTARASAEYLYFGTYANQRAWNTNDEVKWDVPLGRLTPFVGGAYSNTRNRPGFEIDARVRQIAHDVGVGSDLKLSSKLNVLASLRRSRTEYDDQDLFKEENLAGALNEWANTEQLRVKYRLTTLTSFLLNAEAIQDRFDHYRLRNANSIRVLPGFEMKPAALISGKVFVGYRDLEPLDPSVPRMRGLVTAVDAVWIARATKANLKVDRDVAFSYQALRPYYVLTDARLSVVERISYTWDVVARGGVQRLDYRLIADPPPDLLPQLDRIVELGGGIGYRFGRTFRLGVDAEYYRRGSTNDVVGDYKGMRAGASVTYGLPQ
jgi:putative beta-barrel porin BBP2